MNAPTREHTTRKPTGKPPWPITLLAGAEKSGKTWGAALAAQSELIGRTFWATFGEDQPDEYGQIAPDFDIVDHDGTYRDFLDALRWVNAQPLPADGAPLLVVDSMSRLWDLLSAQAQETAWQRAAEKAARKKQPLSEEDPSIGVDLWNVARQRWDRVMDEIRAFPGPVVLTARLDVVAVIGPNGSPTGAKQSKVQAHKSLPFDVGAIVEMPARGEAWLTGVRSVGVALPERLRFPDFTVEKLWQKLGVDQLVIGARDHAAPRIDLELDASDGRPQRGSAPQRLPQPAPATPPKDWDPVPWEDAIAAADTIERLRVVHADAQARKVLAYPISSGVSLGSFLRSVKARMQQDAEAAA